MEKVPHDEHHFKFSHQIKELDAIVSITFCPQFKVKKLN